MNQELRDTTDTTPLMAAATKGDVATIRDILANGGSVDEADAEGWTPLMFAARNGCTEAVKVLLDAGANPNAEDVFQRSVLELAEEFEYTEIEQLLRGRRTAFA